MSDTTMDFIERLKFHKKSVVTDLYQRYVMATLRKQTAPPQFVPGDKLCFELNLPVRLDQFLLECNTLLDECIAVHIDISEISADYLITLIYTALSKEDVESEDESVPMQGLLMFLTLNSCDSVGIIDRYDIAFKSMYEKVVGVYMHRVLSKMEISINCIKRWNKFLILNKHHLHMGKVIDLFLFTLSHNPITTKERNNVVHRMVLSRTIFELFESMVEIHQLHDQKELVTILAIKLIDMCNMNTHNEPLLRSILYFFKDTLQQFCNQTWYFPLLIMLLKEIKKKELFIHILNHLPVEKHDTVTNIMINNYIKAADIKDIEVYLVLIHLVVKFPYQNMPDDRRQKLVKRILTETYLRSSHKSLKIKEHVMNLFIAWSQMKDINVRQNLQLMFHHGHKTDMAHLFEILLQAVELSWKAPAYNMTFVIFTCRMFMLNRNFITQDRMRIMEIVCYKSTAHCLKPCVPVIMDLVKHVALSPHPILKPMLTLLLNNALSATTAANYYLKKLFGLLSNCMDATSDSDVEFSLCNTILSDDFQCLDLFKMIRIHNFVRAEHIQALLQEKILKQTCSWKLLTVLLENIDYTEFPPFMQLYLQKIKMASFFIFPESLYVLQVLTKIFKAKLKKKVVTEADTTLAIMIDNSVTNHIRDMSVPPKQIGEAFILLVTLGKITNANRDWINFFFSKILNLVLLKMNQNAEENVRFPLARYVIYLDQMIIILDMNMEETNIKKIMHALSKERQAVIANGQIHAGVLSFLGKICLKYTAHIAEALPLFQFGLVNGPPAVQIMAMSTLYDISNLHLHNYHTLYSGLVALIRSDKIDVRNMSVKMIVKLVNENHISLSCTDFISLMLVLLERNYKLCLYFVELFENDFVHKNELTITKYFIHLLFYLNNYRDDRRYAVILQGTLDNEDFTYERRIILYRVLFSNLDRQRQLKILNGLNVEFLELFYKERLNIGVHTLNILRDILTLLCFNASQYLEDSAMKDIDQFYTSLFVDMRRDFFMNKLPLEPNDMDFDKTIDRLLVSLLKLLYKIEKCNLNMLPQFFSAVGLVTRAFYEKVVRVVQVNTTLRNLYYELENCYNKYKEMVRREPLDFLSYCDKQEWRTYLV